MNHLYKKLIHQKLSQIKDAHIKIKDGKVTKKYGKFDKLSAKIEVLDSAFYKNIIFLDITFNYHATNFFCI